jgi:hypothetical protein
MFFQMEKAEARIKAHLGWPVYFYMIRQIFGHLIASINIICFQLLEPLLYQQLHVARSRFEIFFNYLSFSKKKSE